MSVNAIRLVLTRMVAKIGLSTKESSFHCGLEGKGLKKMLIVDMEYQ